MALRIIFFIIFGVISSSVYSYEVKDKYTWKLLGHYFDHKNSQVDSEKFFIANNGKKNSRLELLSTINSLKTNQKKRCQFPARFLFLKKERILSGNLNTCIEYNKFKSKLIDKDLSIVFASYYVDSASSFYGHTFFHFKSKDNLLYKDYAVNFAANPNTKNPLLYAYRGIFGGFPGTYSLLPYYYKLSEYSHLERRDIWSYSIDLSVEQKELLIAHLWELRNIKFDYFYLTENCAYHLITLIDLVIKEKRILDSLPYFATPLDSIITLKDLNIIKTPSLTPSSTSKALKAFRNSNNKSILLKSLETKDLKNIKGGDLIVLNKIVDSKYPQNYSTQKNSDEKKFKRKILKKIANSNLEIEEEKLNKPRPELIHGTRRTTLSSSKEENSDFILKISHRFRLHSIEDFGDNFPKNSSLETGKATLEFNTNNQEYDITDFTLLNILSSKESIPWENNISWLTKIAYTKGSAFCDSCKRTYIKFGMGKTFSYLNLSWISVLGTNISLYNLKKNHSFDTEALFKNLIIFNISKIKFLMNYELSYSTLRYKSLEDSIELFLLKEFQKDLSIFAKYNKELNEAYELGLNIYY